MYAIFFFLEILNRSRTRKNWYLLKPKCWHAKLALPYTEFGWGP